jgi:hypothetical protein
MAANLAGHGSQAGGMAAKLVDWQGVAAQLVK